VTAIDPEAREARKYPDAPASKRVPLPLASMRIKKYDGDCQRNTSPQREPLSAPLSDKKRFFMRVRLTAGGAGSRVADQPSLDAPAELGSRRREQPGRFV
jgi:hypothetical protein